MNGVEKRESIIINNAAVNNLKNINVAIPINSFTCITGVSGCGKSSLVYDTIYAESQRDFLESMSGNMYGQKLMNKPNVENIENLRPALSVSQNYYNHNPRSTVGTLTDVSHFLRTLYALVINFEQGTNYGENFFSANNPSSCCRHCNGLGEEDSISEDLLIPNRTKRLKDGAIIYYKGKDNSIEHKLLIAICDYYHIDINKSINELSKNDLFNLLYRENDLTFHLTFKTPKGRYRQKDVTEKGAIIELRKKLEDVNTPSIFANISKYLVKKECSVCRGTRLKNDVLEKNICNNNIADVEKLKLNHLLEWLKEVDKKYQKCLISNQIEQLIGQISKRIAKMIELKLEYISVNRSVITLSGGEIQRIRIANQLNCSLKGVIYILDEPCRGLHYRDIESIISATKELVDKENTVIAIEHNKQYISQADKIIELGPEGGANGGYILNDDKLLSDFEYRIKYKNEKELEKFFKLRNICYRNINNQNVDIPIGAITCITGVSGSGKSTLVSVISECFKYKRNIYCDLFYGCSKIKKVYNVNQQPIGKTPRSTVVSYLEIYDLIRELFVKCSKSKKIGLSASDFSMNVKGGRCECCKGTGLKKIELNYLPDSYVICPECDGKRFSQQVLSVEYKGKNISDVLDIPIIEIIDLFQDHEIIYEKLKCMINIGLGYVKLGQMSMNLSGGEAQRIKLAKVLGIKSRGKNMYILDEPTSGLHPNDIHKLGNILTDLERQGETILIIEHNIEFIASVADYMIDFGVKAGDDGGIIEVQGRPNFVINNSKSSWRYLKNLEPNA